MIKIMCQGTINAIEYKFYHDELFEKCSMVKLYFQRNKSKWVNNFRKSPRIELQFKYSRGFFLLNFQNRNPGSNPWFRKGLKLTYIRYIKDNSILMIFVKTKMMQASLLKSRLKLPTFVFEKYLVFLSVVFPMLKLKDNKISQLLYFSI